MPLHGMVRAPVAVDWLAKMHGPLASMAACLPEQLCVEGDGARARPDHRRAVAASMGWSAPQASAATDRPRRPAARSRGRRAYAPSMKPQAGGSRRAEARTIDGTAAVENGSACSGLIAERETGAMSPTPPATTSPLARTTRSRRRARADGARASARSGQDRAWGRHLRDLHAHGCTRGRRSPLLLPGNRLGRRASFVRNGPARGPNSIEPGRQGLNIDAGIERAGCCCVDLEPIGLVT